MELITVRHPEPWAWKRDLRRALVLGLLTFLIGQVVAQTVTFPSGYVSPERDEQQMLMDTVGALGLVAAAVDFFLSWLMRRRGA